MRKLVLPLFFLLFATTIQAQQNKLSVVWDLSNADTAVQAGVFRQINNARAQKPNLEIEVVFHGQAVLSLLKEYKNYKINDKVYAISTEDYKIVQMKKIFEEWILLNK
jgi:intracellular sulfur oxidation DsrE/DsrF family protein